MRPKPRAWFRAAAAVIAGSGAALAVVTAPAGATRATTARATTAQSSAAGALVADAITTLAGGVGRPALATQISFRGRHECDDVQFASGHLSDNPGVGHIRVVATRTGVFYGRRMKAGDIYQIAGVRKGLTGNGVPAARADTGSLSTIAIDGQGNVAFIAGTTVRAIAERAGTFYGQHMKAGDVYTVVGNPNEILYAGEGGPATSAQGVTGGVAVDAAGNLLIANRRLRVVAASTRTFYGKAMTKGHIYTIAGSGTRDTGGTAVGDGGPAIRAKLSAADVAADALGNLVVTDADGHRIRVVAKRTGRFYGQPMTAGHIYTVAGDGVKGISGKSSNFPKPHRNRYHFTRNSSAL